ncbi:MAG: chromate resistance protein ChrB domain-containing protein [Verrucomicrobiota bacterium]
MTECPWLLLLYSLPKMEGSARVGIWRKMKKSGALPFKASAYLLPNRPELFERFQWLAQQVQDAGGEATVAFVSELEGISHADMVRQFNESRAGGYAELIAPLNDVIARQRKKADDAVRPELEKLRRQFEDLRSLDFFDCPRAHDVAMLLERAASLPEKKSRGKEQPVLSTRRYVGKTWLTRPQPAIDRVGSAWLIRKFIDPKASFVFARDPAAFPNAIPYDMTGVEFTHHGEECTFETLLKRFDLREKALIKLGEMIHDADLEDGKFQAIEAIGLDRVFKGWAKLGLADDEILSRGFLCFDALHALLKIKS